MYVIFVKLKFNSEKALDLEARFITALLNQNNQILCKILVKIGKKVTKSFEPHLWTKIDKLSMIFLHIGEVFRHLCLVHW